MININSKCNSREKRALWKDLLLRRTSLVSYVWCVLGDFNYVCSPSKRVGGEAFEHHGNVSHYAEFSNFIYQMELWDIPLLVRSFTWF